MKLDFNWLIWCTVYMSFMLKQDEIVWVFKTPIWVVPRRTIGLYWSYKCQIVTDCFLFLLVWIIILVEEKHTMFGCEYTIWKYASILLEQFWWMHIFLMRLFDFRLAAWFCTSAPPGFVICGMGYYCMDISADFLGITLYVQTDLFKHFREDVSLRLWNSDFKRQIDGIELLQKVRN